MDFIDLHVHSSCSDGTLSPAQVTSLAAQNGLRAIALTDHDTVSGISEALEAGKKLGVEIIPGIELSTNYQNRDIHIVGLHINPCDAYFLETLKEFQSSRDQRNEKIIGLLQQAGISISRKAMEDTFPDCVSDQGSFCPISYGTWICLFCQGSFPPLSGRPRPLFCTQRKSDSLAGHRADPRKRRHCRSGPSHALRTRSGTAAPSLFPTARSRTGWGGSVLFLQQPRGRTSLSAAGPGL